MFVTLIPAMRSTCWNTDGPSFRSIPALEMRYLTFDTVMGRPFGRMVIRSSLSSAHLFCTRYVKLLTIRCCITLRDLIALLMSPIVAYVAAALLAFLYVMYKNLRIWSRTSSSSGSGGLGFLARATASPPMWGLLGFRGPPV